MFKTLLGPKGALAQAIISISDQHGGV